MPLLDEGTKVWRPVQAHWLIGGTFHILGPMPEGEKWAFEAGENVTVEITPFANGVKRTRGKWTRHQTPPTAAQLEGSRTGDRTILDGQH